MHAPNLRFGFAGDDFQWWQHARAALDEPRLLVAPFGGFRPALTWLMALEHLVFGTSPAGYHAVSLALHLGCGVLLWLVLVRLFGPALGPTARALIVTLWLTSPFSAEPVQSVVACNYLLLLACWLGLALVWPGPSEAWGRLRLVVALLLAALSAALLEGWVMLPGFVLVHELALRRASIRDAVRRSAWTALPVLAYLLVYFSLPPFQPQSYYTEGLGGAAKVPHIWAAFCGMTTLRPLEISLGGAEMLALLALCAFAWIGFRRLSGPMLQGAAFFILPLAPLIPVGFLTTRYTTIPLIGFLLMTAAAFCSSPKVSRHERLRAARVAVGGVALLYLVSGCSWVAGETSDRARLDQLHRTLLVEAASFSPRFPTHGVVVCVRRERANPLLELSLTGTGLPKIYFPRHPDPYALVDTAALWSWVLEPRGGPLYSYVAPGGEPPARFSVVAHDEGRFVELEPGPSLALTVSHWTQAGYHVRVLTPRRDDDHGTD